MKYEIEKENERDRTLKLIEKYTLQFEGIIKDTLISESR